MMKLATALFALTLSAAPLAYADGKHDKTAAMAEGEIRRVDKEARKITIKHGPLAKLDMPAMTMVFQVRDPAMLERVKPGDRIRFEAEKVAGGYAVTRMEPAN